MTNPQPETASGADTGSGGGKLIVILLPLLVVGTFVVLIISAISGDAVTTPRAGSGADTDANADSLAPGRHPDAYDVPDGTGAVVTLNGPPQRIVSCTMGSDEILAELVQRRRIAGITRFSVTRDDSFLGDSFTDFPAERLIAQVQESAERIVSWKPDLLIVAQWTDAGFRTQMQAASIPVLALHPTSSVESARQNVRLLGQALKREPRASEIVAAMDRQLAAAADLVADLAPLRALSLGVGEGKLFTSTSRTTAHDVMTRAGFVNLGADGPGELTMEQLRELDATGIDVILLTDRASPDGPDPLERLRAMPGADSLSVLQREAVIRVHPRWFSTTSHHIAEAVHTLATANANWPR